MEVVALAVWRSTITVTRPLPVAPARLPMPPVTVNGMSWMIVVGVAPIRDTPLYEMKKPSPLSEKNVVRP